MIGDNHHDVSAARAAGMSAIAVTWGYSHVPHEELGADRLIDSFAELVSLMDTADDLSALLR
jgi:phosphoglycolate phosphatase